jgi:hypothetical protein
LGFESPPLPIVSSLRAPDSRPLTFRNEIAQGFARRRVRNLRVGHKENLRARRSSDPATHGRWTPRTFLAALRHDRVTAPWLIARPIVGQSFPSRPRRSPCPRSPPGFKHGPQGARRTVETVSHAIADILLNTSSAECSHDFARAGYSRLQSLTLQIISRPGRRGRRGWSQ